MSLLSQLALIFAGQSLARLGSVDILVIAIYFAIVIFIGFYLKGSSNTSEEFFMAGREMTAWIAGLSFVSANLGSLELMGWAGSAYQYGILATHWYWIGAIPAMLFLGIVMMPFYYISKVNSVPGYLNLRFGDGTRALSAVSFAFMTILMSGINMYSMALVMKVVLGWNLNFSIWVSSLTVAVYVALGGLRSAIFNEVLQFVLIWLGALLVPILGLIEAGGWNNLKRRSRRTARRRTYVHMWARSAHFRDNPMGVHWSGIVFGLGSVISFGYWTTDFLVVQRVLSAKSAVRADGSDHRGRLQDDGAVYRDSSRAAWRSPCCLFIWSGEAQAVATGAAQLQRSAAADAGALLRSRAARAGRDGADRGLHVGHGGQRQRLFDGVDLRHLRRLICIRRPATSIMSRWAAGARLSAC